MSLPEHGSDRGDILDQLGAMAEGDVRWRSGRAFSLAYDAGDDVYDLAKEVNGRFMSTNALNPFAFPSLGLMQSEVVGMVSELLHGGEEAAGYMTTGGTETILLAAEAARNGGRDRGVTRPRAVVPTTALAAFTKGGSYFGVEVVRVAVGDDFRADPEAMAEAVTDDTVLVVASSPTYPQGVSDPVADIAAIAAERDILCHVDACMGGITLPFLERRGEPIPPFDFRVPGVTSMSVDLHKYGYTAKGASVILHRSADLRRYQPFVTDDWLGGFYASSGLLGTKSGGPIAAAWWVMRYLGAEGYLRLTGAARDATVALLEGLRAVPGVVVLGDPSVTLVAFTFDDADPFAVGKALWDRGWWVDQQGPPPSLHCMVNAVHTGVIDEFLGALAEAHEEVRAASTEASQAPYGAV